MKTIWNNFKVAFAMYSKIPMPPADWEKENMKYALCFFPWVGLAVGAVSAVLFWLLQQIGAGSMLRAAVLTAVPVLVTGGIHLDGYLDTMDALSSWREKQRRLEILKDPHAGAFAIIMGCLYFVLYAGAAGELVWKIFPAYAFGFAVSRSFSGLSIAFFPNANPKGTAAAFGMSAEKKRTAAVLVVTIFAVTVLSASFCVWAALDVLVVSALVFCYYKWKSSKYFGGITGDLAGYFLSLCELAQLLVVGLDQIRAAGQSFPQGAAAGIHNHFLALRLGQAAQGGVEVPRHALGHAAGNGHHFRLPQLALVVRQEALQLLLGDGVARLQELGALVCLPVPDVDAAAGLPPHLGKGRGDARGGNQALEELAVIAAHKAHGGDVPARQGGHPGDIEPLAPGGVHHLLHPADAVGGQLFHQVQLVDGSV